MTSLLETEGKEYLMGILDRIEVQYNFNKKEHILDIKFKLPLVGNSIEYQDIKNKKKGYLVVDGDPVPGVKIPLQNHTEKSKVPPNRTIPPWCLWYWPLWIISKNKNKKYMLTLRYVYFLDAWIIEIRVAFNLL